MLCGTLASWLSNLIWNGAFAGAVSEVTWKAMSLAVSSMTVPVGAEPEAAGLPDAAGEPEAARGA